MEKEFNQSTMSEAGCQTARGAAPTEKEGKELKTSMDNIKVGVY